MSRVVETHLGEDGLVRVVSVRTPVGVLRRPLMRLVLLPVALPELDVPINSGRNRTSQRRRRLRTRRKKDQKVATTLERVQRTAALRITGGYRTTSAEALLVLAGLIPLGLKLEEEAIRQKIWEDRKDALGLEAGTLEWKRDPRKPPQWLPKWNWSPGVPTGIGTEVFTDGSKSGTNTGAGVVIFTNGELIFQESLTLRLDELVYSTELVAIREALRVCAEKNLSPERLYSDCMSALVAINLEKGQLAHQIIQELETMPQAPALHWVRGHSLIEGNEFAHRLAKAGCFRGRSVRTPVTKKEVYGRIRGHVQDLWLYRWRNSKNGREVFNWVTVPKYL
ncbi:hypothetical protein LAZ67_17002420 [Cordylochernes scorpioides]|uniref:RNase H type-1 domain-containing protein n=1 Tax=Cordylochernes scorpioides TaxID=51811 RepID=A0ABY6LFC4_9ARAC|nr:hypothetical protein LAZ67_17002420 [Cordylochernes scorpioides]